MNKSYEELLLILETRMFKLVNQIIPSLRLDCGLTHEYKSGEINPLTKEEMVMPIDESTLAPSSKKAMLYYARGAMFELGTLLSFLPDSKAFNPNADLGLWLNYPTELMVSQMDKKIKEEE
mgnify:FL=1|tara:strand:- start:150 stop:512 length:363 start_codon:yes stop_codon:yes gene_type:complete